MGRCLYFVWVNSMVLVTVMRFGVFLRPTCIAIFLPALGCVGLKAFGALACFDLRVLLAGITLTWLRPAPLK